ncbi:transmembrane protein, putative (macronuclear) [Tetrahymena thermophila SB210]|uniref:Transmembrane protein, putative n=1 Tax=Tetrahymena thermophila (strain SB210) TaxID=312017 RepID=Q22KD0_TETTS|nr:transmembrane protein, putative [Tetrahymena thermophila SB210]EAR85869.2 transmembrane protein, putative [Tetrahymena thermophila SB210]|eukprot:XP_001033532.2 transmembrane protein, putative [Tetrahymena thermophila SB210]
MYQKADQSFCNIIRSIDIFGHPIQINFNQNSKYKTKCGGFVTLVLLTFITAISIQIIIEIVQKQNPQIVQRDQIKVPERVNLNRNNFIFALGLLDENQNPFMDEEIYKVTAQFTYKEPVQNNDGTVSYSFITQNIRIGACDEDLFGIIELQKYYTEIQNYKQLYCLLDIDQLYLEGQFEANEFSTIQIYINPCFDNGCKDKDYVINKIKHSIFQVYFSNNLVKPFDFNNPFEPFSESAYYYVNLNQLQIIQFTYMNTYVIDDLGLITSSIKQQKQLIYSQNIQSTNSDISKGIFQIGIYLEKNKEQYVNRSYTKVISAISQIGGIYNVIFFIGCILTQPYSFLEFKRSLINKTFTFDFQELQSTKKICQEQNTAFLHTEKKQFDCFKYIKNKIKPSKKFKKSRKQLDKNDGDQIQNQQIKNIEKLSSFQQEYSVQNSKSKGQIFEKVKKGINYISDFTISSYDYILFYLKCFKSSELYNFLSYSTNKITELTDIEFILNKLIELEKLKHLLLNQQQLKLFDYIPKPKITKDVIKINSICQSSQQKEEENPPVKNKKIEFQEFNLLATLNKTKCEIDMEGQIAYYQISKCQKKLSKLDTKLLSFLGQDTQQMLSKQIKTPILNNIEEQTQNSPEDILGIGNSSSINFNLLSFNQQPQNKSLQLKHENIQEQSLEEQKVHSSKIQQVSRNILTEEFNKNLSSNKKQSLFTKKNND